MNLLIKKEYFGLLGKLNLSNKYKNEQTHIYFYIDETNSKSVKLYAAISESQRILLCEKDPDDFWIPLYLSGFSKLEEFIADILNTQKEVVPLTDFIKLHIFKLEQ